jgi:hypothetical protein
MDRDDALFMMRFDQLYRPSRLAKQFVWSAGLAATAAAGRFFDEYSLDSDERFHINEVATYFERLGSFWRAGIVPPDVALNWISADLYWDRIGSILIQARDIFESPDLWRDFEALAEAHRTAAGG